MTKPFLAILLALILAACTDDDTFSVSTADCLTFSADTVRLDTVFSRTPTTTRTFWVYNNSGKSLRLSNIRLTGGNQTGFRVNVNGVYLGASQGYQLSDEEVRKGDSLRVFVEATLPLNGQREPQKVSDDLLFTLESGLTQSVNLNAWAWDAEKIATLNITRDTTLATTMPLVIGKAINVAEGATLTIAAGQTVYFHDRAQIIVKGRLVCDGAAGSEVTLRGDRLDRMFPYLPYDGVSGQWGGIVFASGSYGNVLRHTDLHSATDAIRCDSSDTSREKLLIENSTVHNNKGYGIISDNSRLTLRNSLISNALGDCLSLRGGAAELNGCTLAQFYPFDTNRGAALRLADKSADGTPRPMERLTVSNTIITGYDDDVLFADIADSTLSRLAFSYCLLRTPEIRDTTVVTDSVIYENPEDTTVAGWKNFRLVDTDMLRYDFHLAPRSLAVGSASPLTSLPADRDALPRKDPPSIGCYDEHE